MTQKVTITARKGRRKGRQRVSINFGKETQVEQAHRDICTPQAIVERYQKTGFIPQPKDYPRFGDFTNVEDFMQVQMKLQSANEEFMSLPVDVRAKFHNSPAELIAYLNNPENRSEAVEMGLLPPEVSEDPSDSQSPQQPRTAAERSDGGEEPTQTDASG